MEKMNIKPASNELRVIDVLAFFVSRWKTFVLLPIAVGIALFFCSTSGLSNNQYVSRAIVVWPEPYRDQIKSSRVLDGATAAFEMDERRYATPELMHREMRSQISVTRAPDRDILNLSVVAEDPLSARSRLEGLIDSALKNTQVDLVARDINAEALNRVNFFLKRYGEVDSGATTADQDERFIGLLGLVKFKVDLEMRLMSPSEANTIEKPSLGARVKSSIRFAFEGALLTFALALISCFSLYTYRRVSLGLGWESAMDRARHPNATDD